MANEDDFNSKYVSARPCKGDGFSCNDRPFDMRSSYWSSMVR